MSWKTHYIERLATQLDPQGDIVPPWAYLPEVERYSIGWRMGYGEDWMGYWSVFLDQLPSDHTTRLEYLRRHAVAPISWADGVYCVLNAEFEREGELTPQQLDGLYKLGVIGSDVAFGTWCARADGIESPWDGTGSFEHAARYNTRTFWFWSRHVSALRQAGKLDDVELPPSWSALEPALRSGALGEIDPVYGLRALALMFVAGRVLPPWQVGLLPDSTQGNFDMDMGYAEAFSLWAMSAFDDAEHLARYTEQVGGVPQAWTSWYTEHVTIY